MAFYDGSITSVRKGSFSWFSLLQSLTRVFLWLQALATAVPTLPREVAVTCACQDSSAAWTTASRVTASRREHWVAATCARPRRDNARVISSAHVSQCEIAVFGVSVYASCSPYAFAVICCTHFTYACQCEPKSQVDRHCTHDMYMHAIFVVQHSKLCSFRREGRGPVTK